MNSVTRQHALSVRAMRGNEHEMKSPVSLVCPYDQTELIPSGDGGYESRSGRKFPSVGGVPRFVDQQGYASAFGAQWKKFQRTQLDSHTGTTLSRDRLERIAGGSLDVFAGKTVLEVGCGAGRFTEILLDAGALVFACDLSVAVEANASNFSDHPNHFVCQADLRNLPVKKEQFDVVICIGVIQHTPSPEETIQRLVDQIAPGGLLLIDHYGKNYPDTIPRRILRAFLLRKPPGYTLPFCEWLCKILWPFHRAIYRLSQIRGLWRLEPIVEKLSPISDYQYGRPELGSQLLFEWAILDTHDSLTDRYKHTRSVDEMRAVLGALPLQSIECATGGNGVECRARKLESARSEANSKSTCDCSDAAKKSNNVDENFES